MLVGVTNACAEIELRTLRRVGAHVRAYREERREKALLHVNNPTLALLEEEG